MNRNSPAIGQIDVIPVTFQLRSPFVTAAGRKTATQNVQVHLRLTNQITGFAEASSSIAMPSESQENLQKALKALALELRGQPIAAYKELIARCWRAQAFHPTAAAAMESAILDAYTRTQGESLHHFLGGKLLRVESDLTLSVVDPTTAAEQTRAAVRKGFRRFKVKLSGAVEKDFERLLAVREAAPSAKLVADGNQGFRVTQAIDLVKRLERSGVKLQFFEQPFPKHDIPSMRQFKSRSKMPLFADESVLSPTDAVKLFQAQAADGVNVKVAKSGLLAALDIIRVAQRFGKRLAIGCMEESKLGLAASVHLACGTGAFEWVDLDSIFLLEPSRLRGGFSTRGAQLSVSVKALGSGL